MSDLKTKPNKLSVRNFIEDNTDGQKKIDSFKLLEIFNEVTNEEPRMWGSSIIGYGTYHYVYKSGREGDWMLTGFSPRKAKFSIYIMSGFEKFEALLAKLGKFKTGKGCLYVNKLSDIDLEVLKELISKSIIELKEMYGSN